MPLPQRWNAKRKAPPPGFDYVEPVLEALENELRDKVKESNLNKRKTESVWPIHQINWQKSRYIYDLYYTHKRISKLVYQYCIDQKLVDAALMAKWKKPGYERLCSTYVINPANYKFGTTSICRVPWKDRTPEQRQAQDPTTGCRGCASGKDAGPRNIFGNKYGQNLAAVQMARENRKQRQRGRREEEATGTNKEKQQQHHHKENQEEQLPSSAAVQQQQGEEEGNNDNHHAGDSSTDEDDDDNAETGDEEDSDYGPTAAAGIWAGSRKLQRECERIAASGNDDEDDDDDKNDAAGDDGAGETDDDDEDDYGPTAPPNNNNNSSAPPSKKQRTDE